LPLPRDLRKGDTLLPDIDKIAHRRLELIKLILCRPTPIEEWMKRSQPYRVVLTSEILGRSTAVIYAILLQPFGLVNRHR
jgi:hypothetical protein